LELLKIHKSYRDLVAVCDTELLGKYFEEGGFQLDVKESFYKGDEIDDDELQEILQDMRKEAGYKPRHKIVIKYEAEGELSSLILQQQKSLKENVGAKEMQEGIGEKEVFDIQKELQVDGKKLDEDNSLSRIIAGKKPGESVNLKVLSKGEEKYVEVKLEEIPESV